MNIIIAIAAALLPVVLLLYYVWWKDPQKEPGEALWAAFRCGVFICIPAALLEFGIESVLFGNVFDPSTAIGATVRAFFVAALPEEGLKLLGLWFVLRNNKYFDEHVDGIVYAVCVSLGFAAFENITYVVNQPQWLQIALSRAFLSVPGHYAFGVLMGYYYSIYHFVDHSFSTYLRILFVPVLAHGIYDAILMVASVSDPTISIICFIVLIYFCIKLHRLAFKRLEILIKKDKNRNDFYDFTLPYDKG